MLNSDFYFGHIRKYVALFGTLFNDIVIVRDGGDVAQQAMKVPISYGPRDKTLARIEADPTLTKMPSIVLPRMSFEITSFTYAPQRKLSTVGMKTKRESGSNSTMLKQYNPVPYDIGFELSIMAKNAEDATKIVEQILPFFTPDFTPTIRLIPDMDIDVDIPIVLQNVRYEDQYEGNFEQRRAIIWTLDFSMKAYIYGPIRGGVNGGRSGKIINLATVNIYDWGKDANTLTSSVTVQPGLTANGQPTSDINQTIDKNLINVTDDFGFITTVTDYSE